MSYKIALSSSRDYTEILNVWKNSARSSQLENIKPVDPLLYSQLIHQKKHWIYEKKNAF